METYTTDLGYLYNIAYSMCSKFLQSITSIDTMKKDFEQIIPTDWGKVDPIEIIDHDQFPFIYIALGGEVYSEAIIISSFILEDNEIKIHGYEFGRP
jgi:hypothetical protein